MLKSYLLPQNLLVNFLFALLLILLPTMSPQYLYLVEDLDLSRCCTQSISLRKLNFNVILFFQESFSQLLFNSLIVKVLLYSCLVSFYRQRILHQNSMNFVCLTSLALIQGLKLLKNLMKGQFLTLLASILEKNENNSKLITDHEIKQIFPEMFQECSYQMSFQKLFVEDPFMRIGFLHG